jgi:hypothetical protein
MASSMALTTPLPQAVAVQLVSQPSLRFDAADG